MRHIIRPQAKARYNSFSTLWWRASLSLALTKPCYCVSSLYFILCTYVDTLCTVWGWNFKELLRNKLRLNLQLSWGSAHGSYCVQILNWVAWPWALLYVPILWTHRVARSKVSLRWQDLRLNTRTQTTLEGYGFATRHPCRTLRTHVSVHVYIHMYVISCSE